MKHTRAVRDSSQSSAYVISEYNGNYTFVIWNSELLSIDCGTLLSSFYTLFSGCAFRKQIGWLTYAQFHHIISCLFILNKTTFILFFFVHLTYTVFTYTVNAIIICHQITCYYNTEDAVMKMQYILLYNLFFHAYCLIFSPHSLLYCTNSPNISYAMSRLQTLQAASYLLLSFHRMSVPHAEFTQCSSGLSLLADFGGPRCSFVCLVD